MFNFTSMLRFFSRPLGRLTGLLTLALIPICLLLVGCSDDGGNVMAPEVSNASPEPISDFSFDPSQAIEVDPATVDWDGMTTAGPPWPTVVVLNWCAFKFLDADAGGTMYLGARMELEFPADALPRDALIQAHLAVKIAHGEVDWVFFDFNPPMTFNTPATLRVKEELIASTVNRHGDYVLWYFNPSLRKWQFETSGEVVDGFVEFTVQHFSKYAIGR